MDFENYLSKHNAQKKINKASEMYKNRKILIWGADEFAKIIFEKYDLSKLNIVAICDKNFENGIDKIFTNYPCILPQNIEQIDFDIILVADYEYPKCLTFLDDHVLYRTKYETVEIRPLIKLNFFDIVFKN